ncbi:MAG: tRNA (adenosine(37)-N6)-threonylcarbamoyltransferase complex dimerization subunit type 1 TsaB [Acidobacteria bacterium]|nr:tRNA (adenosine(37)-N6)-threonylcarbamoyltransferase complex dimerization subunit type 1 TsaB [Acidobacteriota bacterium]
MRLLAVDTTTARGSVALLAEGEVRGEVRLDADAHSKRILPAVDFLLRSLGLRPAELDAFAVATGPGSFTGLRVGISTVQGLALGAGRPCVGIPALDVLAARIRGVSSCLVAWMDAWRGEVYGALYDSEARRQGDITAEAPDAFLARVPEGAGFTGDGARLYRELILSRRPGAILPERGLFLAGTLATLAAERVAGGEVTGPGELRPVYVREAAIRPASRP